MEQINKQQILPETPERPPVRRPLLSAILIILIFFVMLTNPVSSHALARASHAIGVFETETTAIDKLDDAEERLASDMTTEATEESTAKATAVKPE